MDHPQRLRTQGCEHTCKLGVDLHLKAGRAIQRLNKPQQHKPEAPHKPPQAYRLFPRAVSHIDRESLTANRRWANPSLRARAPCPAWLPSRVAELFIHRAFYPVSSHGVCDASYGGIPPGLRRTEPPVS